MTGTTVTINGSGFQGVEGSGSVCLNIGCTPTVMSWSDTQIVFAVPANASSGSVKILTNSGDVSNRDFVFTMPNPIVNSVLPASGPVGTQVQINGSGFGSTQGSSTVNFNAIFSGVQVVSWSDTQIVAAVPATAMSGPVFVSEGSISSNNTIYYNVPAPTITSISPAIGGAGNAITINGTGFQATQGAGNTNYVGFSGSGGTALIRSWSDTQIIAIVPPGTTTGYVDVNVNSIPSNYVDYAIPSQAITTITPNTGPVGTQVTIAGTAFGSTQGTNVLSFNGQNATVSSWTNTQIVATVPVTAASGPAVVTVAGVNSNALTFTVPAPNLNAFLPLGGIAGTQVTLTGAGFQASQRDSTVTFNGVAAAVTSWSDTQIVATVPSSATTGPLLVTVNSVSSPNNSFNIFEVPNPVITSVTPPEAPPNGAITISGTGFGSTGPSGQNPCWALSNCHVRLNGVDINFTSWSDTTIVAQVPSGATSGPLMIVKYDSSSSTIPFTVEGAPSVSGLAPAVGPVATSVVISGGGFGTSQSSSTVQFSGVLAQIANWTDTSITAVVPPGSETGPVVVTVAGVTGTSQDFTINNSVQVTNSLGLVTSYVSTMLGGAWHPTFSMGGGCSSCTFRGALNRDLDSAGNTVANTDELQRKTFYAYDANDNLISSTEHLDPNTPVTTSYTYNSFGEPLTVTDPLGNVTTNTYDANGNLLTVTSPASDGSTAASVTQFAYDTRGQLTQIIDPLNHITTMAYYPTGLIHTITDAQSNVTSYEYDLRGNRTAVVDALNNRTTFVYDLGNRLTSITYPDSSSVSIAYDSRGRRTSVTDQNGKVTAYAYDDADRLTSVNDAAQNVTSYAYDTENNLLSITDANSHTTSFAYDAFGRVTQTIFPSTLAETYIYDTVGNLSSKTDRKNQTIQYVYDELNRLSHKGYPDATGVDYVYDLVGKIKQVTDPTGTYGFTYDNMGRLLGTTTQYSFLPGNTYTNAYTYDAASNRTGFTAPDGTTNSYAYDTLGRLSTLTNSLTGQFGFSYDTLSRRTALNRPNGVNTNYHYDSLSRLLSVLHQNGTTTLDGAGYIYDNAGNRTAKTNYLNNITEQYTYDPAYQLTQVTQGATTTESYSYDAVGNRLSALGMSSYAYNSSNELTSTPASTFTYDNDGNTLTKADSSGTTSYNWDFENRLTSVVLPGTGGTVAFKNDPFGNRVQKASSTGTFNYFHDGISVVEEVDARGNKLVSYMQGIAVDEHLAEARSGISSYYQQDRQGSVTSLSDLTGNLTNTYVYDAFGTLTAFTGTLTNTFQYTGREYDPETQLLYYRARYYDPVIGRFDSEDSIGFKAGGNFYAYVFNNPINHIDPTGHFDNPGCDGVPHRFEKPCILECCAIHDECYDRNKCGAGSWCWAFWGKCNACNDNVKSCIMRCIGHSDHDDPKRPNCYYAKLHKWGPCPWEPGSPAPLPTPTPSPTRKPSTPTPTPGRK